MIIIIFGKEKGENATYFKLGYKVQFMMMTVCSESTIQQTVNVMSLLVFVCL